MGYIALLAPLLVALACVPFALPFGANLEYEYATVTAWIIIPALIVAAYTAPSRIVIQAYDVDLPATNSVGKLFTRRIQRVLWMLLGAPLVTFVPGLVAFTSGQCPCSRNGYVFWMTLQVIPAVWIGMGLFWLILRFRVDQLKSRSGKRKIMPFLIVLLILICVTCLGLAVLWFAPQKRLVHMFFGFLHGPVYDQWIPVDNGVVYSRVLHGFVGWCIAWMAWNGFDKGRKSFRGPAIAFGCTALLWYLMGSYPSLGWGQKPLQERLSRAISQGFITMHFEGDDAATSADMRVLLDEATFHANDLAQILNVAHPRPIDIYVYPSDVVKKSYFGGGSTDVTDVWTPTVHITRSAAPHPNLRHELVHAVASQFGWHGLGFHPNMVITEGLAVALAPQDDRFDLDEASAAIIKSGRIKRVEGLFSPTGFWSQSGSRAYTIAGSFLGYILKEAGAGAVLRIYAGESVSAATGKPIKEWILRWKVHIEKRYEPSHAIENEAMFRSPGILRDICPHTRTDYARPRTENIWLRLRQPPGWNPGNWLEWRNELSPKDLYVKVELWRERIKLAASERVLSDGAISTWLETVQRAQRVPPKTVEDIELGMIENDLLSLQGHRPEAQKKLNALAANVRARPPGELIERQIFARQRIEELINDDAHAREWRRYLAGWRTIPEVRPDDPWIANYLRMRRERAPKRESVLANALTPIDEMDASFRVEWYRLTAARLISFEDYENAASMYREILKTATGGHRSFYALQLRMVEGMKKVK